jgi:hypothetical protein
MIDPAQTVLFLVIIILTTLLVVLGIQVFVILRELRKAVGKANKILEDTGIITESVSTPLATLSSLMMGIKTGISAANLLKKASKFGERRIEDNKDGELGSDNSLSEDNKKPPIRRFFKGISKKSSL